MQSCALSCTLIYSFAIVSTLIRSHLLMRSRPFPQSRAVSSSHPLPWALIHSYSLAFTLMRSHSLPCALSHSHSLAFTLMRSHSLLYALSHSQSLAFTLLSVPLIHSHSLPWALTTLIRSHLLSCATDPLSFTPVRSYPLSFPRIYSNVFSSTPVFSYPLAFPRIYSNALSFTPVRS